MLDTSHCVTVTACRIPVRLPAEFAPPTLNTVQYETASAWIPVDDTVLTRPTVLTLQPLTWMPVIPVRLPAPVLERLLTRQCSVTSPLMPMVALPPAPVMPRTAQSVT